MSPGSRLLALALAAASAAAAGSPVAAGVPVEHGKAATADASPVDPGVAEIELGYTPVWNDRRGTGGFDDSSAGHVHGFTGTLACGVVPDVDLKLTAGFGSVYAAHVHADGSSPTRGSGLSDLVVGGRWRFLRLPAQALELAVTADLVIPVGSRTTATRLGLSQEFWSARGALVATRDLGALTANAEVALAAPLHGDAGGLRSLLQLNAALGYQLRSWLQPEVELNYQRSASTGPDAKVLAVTAGAVAPFGDGHRVVAALQRGVWGRDAAQTTGAVLSFKTAL